MKKLRTPYLVLMFIILYLPIIYLVVYSFNSGTTMQGFAGFSFKHYNELWEDTRLIDIVFQTGIVALLSSLLATIIGTLGALAIFRVHRRAVKGALLSLNNVLLVSPDVIIGAAFLILFTTLKLSLGFVTVLLAHVAFSIPIVVLMVLPRLQEMNPDLILAAQDLGARPTQVLGQVTIPVITPGIIAGFFMALTYSLDDFAVTFFVTGNGFSTLAVEIYSRARQGVSLEINALSALIFLFSLLIAVGYYFINQLNRRQKAPELREKVK
ncbi:spermidine/purescine ABC transporter permease [Fructobacillus pseudoficulneus]|uniref:Spermidine/purescine ABC transporter permease n=1 Tax=Fructobacillus pseudoficulneus TaxID=220714 RepID=A0A3F3H972_9LACO|nr:ABC transporter permease [Fructobacillus pseudoficulneus]GAP02833.1 spermidine/purescine ABC transporter permease [Fructobacillus pseudoficulneus]SEH45823.1 spermidine/putrescine transport system permease protein [Fructobacillus pseudoficulneus]